MQKICGYMCGDFINDIKLELFHFGSAKVDREWEGNVTNSVYSRLYYVKKGNFYLILNGEKVCLNEGKWYLIPANSSYEFGCGGLTEHLFFHLNLSGVNQTDIFKNEKKVLSISDYLPETEEVIKLAESKNIIDALNVRSIVFKILLKFIKNYGINIECKKYSPCVIKAIEYIKNNLSESLTISKIANSIFVSESTLTKHFRKELSTSVNKYIDELILMRCAQMIIETDLSVAEISEFFGFCDQFYFSRKFKATFGKSPRQYKKSWNV